MQNKAFTLIELAIVLVVIWLIIGGVMVGQELIKTARLHSQIAQIQDLETQINTFSVKYNCLPGDCATATDFLGTTDPSGNTIYNGDNDGLILSRANAYVAGNCLTSWTGGETTQIFLHLKLSGLGNYTATGAMGAVGAMGQVVVGSDLPAAKINTNTGMLVSCIYTPQVPYGPMPAMFDTGNSIIVGLGNAYLTGRIAYRLGRYNTGANITGSGIAPESTRMIDDKIDDGVANKGRVGVIYDCNDTAGASSYTSLASSCMITIARNI